MDENLVIQSVIKHLSGKHEQKRHNRYASMSDRELSLSKVETVQDLRQLNAKLKEPLAKEVGLGLAVAATGYGAVVAFNAAREKVLSIPAVPENNTKRAVGTVGLLAAKPGAAVFAYTAMQAGITTAVTGLTYAYWRRELKNKIAKLEKEVLVLEEELRKRQPTVVKSSTNAVAAELEETVRLVSRKYADAETSDVVADINRVVSLLRRIDALPVSVVKHLAGKHEQAKHGRADENKLQVAAKQTLKNLGLSLRENYAKARNKMLANAEDTSTVKYIKRYAKTIAAIGVVSAVAAVLAFPVSVLPAVAGLAQFAAMTGKRHKERMRDEQYRVEFARNAAPGGDYETVFRRARAYYDDSEKTPGVAPTNVIHAQFKKKPAPLNVKLLTASTVSNNFAEIEELISVIESLPAEIQPAEELNEIKKVLEIAQQLR